MKKLWSISGALFLILSSVASPEAGSPSDAQSSGWWKPDWHYRIKVEVHSGRYERDDEPVELTVDLATLLSQTGISGTLDADSVRVIHQDKSPREVLSQFEPVSGEIIWLTGKMAAGTSKTFYVYFDTRENGPKSPTRYYSTMENGGILVLPVGGHISVIHKMEGREYETVRIDESSGEIDFLKPPLGSLLVDGRGSFLGFKKPAGKVDGRAVSISGGPLRYSVDFHLEPGAEESAVSYSNYRYTFYYASNGQGVRARFSQRWAASQAFIPQRTGAEWPLAFGMRAGIGAGLATAFLATADDTATAYNILATWGPLDGDGAASPVLADNFWGVYGEAGGIGLIPISPAYHQLCVDGHRSNDGWDWSAVSHSQVHRVEKGTYGSDLWIYGYDQNGWERARDFGNRTEEPLTIEADFVISSAVDSRAEPREKPGRLPHREVRPRSGLEHKIYQDDLEKEKYRLAWFGSDWTYRMSLTFDNNSQTENLVDFPVLVVLTPGNFDYSHCQNDGRDIRFVDSDDTTELKYQIEAWNYNGESCIWVKVPQIDGLSATDFIWMYYGNPAAVGGQDAENVWDSDFLAVWHLSEGGAGARHDSTSNHNDGTPQNYDGDEAVAGAIDGADELDGLNDYVRIPGTDIGTTSVTIEAWARFNALDATTFSPVSGASPGGTVFSTRELDGKPIAHSVCQSGERGCGYSRGSHFYL